MTVETAMTAVDQWRADAAEGVCAGSGLPVIEPGHLFGKCSVCYRTLIVHDGDRRLAYRHVHEDRDDHEGPGLTVEW